MLGHIVGAYNIPTIGRLLLLEMLILSGIVIDENWTKGTVKIDSAVSRFDGEWIHIVDLTVFLNNRKYIESILR